VLTPTKRVAWIIGGVAITAVGLPGALVIVFLLAVVAAVGVDAWVGRHPVPIDRQVGDVLSRGVGSPLSISVGQRHARTTVRQPGTPDLVVAPSFSDDGLEGVLTPIRRGRHHLPAVASRVRGPMGLAQWTRVADHEHELLVYPDMPAARRIAAQVRRGTFRSEGLRIQGSLGLGTSFESIREYVDGDDLRRVNWMATARSSAPMVNQYRIDQDRDVMAVVDCGRLMGAPLGSLTRLDAAIDAAVAVGAVADVVGDRVGVVAFDSEIIVDLPPHRLGGESVARAVFEVEPSSVESDYLRAFEQVAGAKRSFVIVFTDLLDESAARPLAAALPTLARKHSIAVASVTDPHLRAALTAIPDDLESAARAAVAVSVDVARMQAASLIRTAGAQVIDVSRAKLSSACVSAYLGAKSRVSF
jgi:uncharacterized protein (DUF58 family)